MRKGSTYHIAKMFLDKITEETDVVTELFLPKDMPEFCRGCATCIINSEERCPDYLIYMRRITRMIDEADLLVFTTPVLVYHASGQMKVLLDHYGYRWMVHRPEGSMFRKQAVVFSTGAGSGMKKAIKDITDSLRFWGVARIYTYGVGVAANSWNDVDEAVKTKIEGALGQLASKIQHEPENVVPSLMTKILFYVMRQYHKSEKCVPLEREYWEKLGWLDKKRPWKSEQES